MSESSELRQRKNAKSSSASSGQKKAATAGELASSILNDYAFPPSVQPYIKQSAPFVRDFIDFLVSLLPLLEQFRSGLVEFWISLKPYKPELLTPAAIGLIMVFFGARYMTLIAAYEAYRLTAHENVSKCFSDLYTDFVLIYEANKKDDAKDDDNDGIADTLEISTNELITRKTVLFLKTVDPQRVTAAIAGLNGGFLAIVATLKVQFVKAITLGNSIAGMTEAPAQTYLVPGLKTLLTPQYEKWAEPLTRYSIKSFAVTVAWTLQRYISAFHSAVRGAHMCSSNLLEYLTLMGYISTEHKNSLHLDAVLSPVLALIGLWFQFGRGFSLPFPLNVFLFPFTVLEYLLMWAVSS